MRFVQAVGVSGIVGLLSSGCLVATTGYYPGYPAPTHFGSAPLGFHQGGGRGFGVSSGSQVFFAPGFGTPSVTTRRVFTVRGGAIPGQTNPSHEQERVRQAQINNELERQIEAKRRTAGGPFTVSGGSQGPSPAPLPSEGVITLTDNLAESPSHELSTIENAGASSGTQNRGGTRAGPGLRRLEEQIAAAHERQRKLLGELQGGSNARRERTGTVASERRTLVGPDGFRPVYEGGRLLRKERDLDGDKKADVIRYYDGTGRLIREEEDSRLDGQVDTIAFYENGRPVRKESDTDGDGKMDLLAFFDHVGDLARTEADTDRDGHSDRVILYGQGRKVEERRFNPGSERPRVITSYAEGQPSRTEEDTDEDGRMDRVTEYDDSGRAIKVSRDPSGQGTFTVFTHYDPETGKVLREEEDLDGDGQIDVTAQYEDGRVTRREFFNVPEVASVKPTFSRPELPSGQELP
ncbi:MAG: FG-GAP repeat domain-containing protein [Candidatus Methylomirabilales bacterium]